LSECWRRYEIKLVYGCEWWKMDVGWDGFKRRNLNQEIEYLIDLLIDVGLAEVPVKFEILQTGICLAL
jgi:hypothetical protein